jgi:hypothetical protein
MTWQPMATAPRDGRWILLRGGRTTEENEPAACRRPVVARYDEDAFGAPRWVFSHWDGEWRGRYERPTHWAPTHGGME